MTVQFPAAGWKDGWFVVPHQVTWRDLDAAGHVNNAVFFTYFEHARTRYWVELTGDGSFETIRFIVARAECDFRRQLSMSEEIEIGVRIGEIRNSSFDFLYRIYSRGGHEIAAEGKVVAVFFSWEENRKLPIDEEWRRRIAKFQEG
jgi:acyl-CoA thioester hydrolase